MKKEQLEQMKNGMFMRQAMIEKVIKDNQL